MRNLTRTIRSEDPRRADVRNPQARGGVRSIGEVLAELFSQRRGLAAGSADTAAVRK